MVDNINLQVLLDPMNIIFSSEDENNVQESTSQQNNSKKGKFWVRPYYLERNRSGAFAKFLNELRQYTRMNTAQFDELLSIVGPLIQKESVLREPLSPVLRLAVTLRYLATGEFQTSTGLAYKCSQTSIHRIVSETTKCIISVLQGKVFPKISTEYFKTVACGFEERWNFPHCIGAIDGKHVTIQAPKKSGSEFYNYKKTSSIVLMAICDHKYNFIWCDIGAAGRQSDGGIFRENSFGKRFYAKTLPLPEPSNVTDKFTAVPYIFVADDAFAMTENMLKPFTTIQNDKHRIFNYRLSRARRMIENCFGILSAKWRIFRTTIIADVTLVEDIIQTCVCLHNWLNQSNAQFVTPDLIDHDLRGVIIPGTWKNNTTNFMPLQAMNRKSTNSAKFTLERFAEYFSEEGQIE